MIAVACVCIALVCITVISRRIPIAQYMRNALRDRRQNNDPALTPVQDQRKPDNDRRKNA